MESKIAINNINELERNVDTLFEIPEDSIWKSFEDLIINIEVYVSVLKHFDFKKDKTKSEKKEQNFFKKKLNFLKSVNLESLEGITLNYSFKNCVFNKEIKLPNKLDGNFEFINCIFYNSFDLNDGKFGGKFKFYNCTFNVTGFKNTTFKDLAEFYNCTFNKKTIFYKTDFLGTTVFSATTFEENVLFTYSLIDKLIIFRGTKFEKGLDLSCTIISGDINPFDIRLENYTSEVIKESDFEKYEKVYESYISEEGKIPIKNQRETYRILKEAFVSRNDISASIRFKVLEKKTLLTELVKTEFWSNFFNIFTLLSNYVSNKFGQSYWRAFWFITLFGGLFFYLSAIMSNTYFYTPGVNYETIYMGIAHFIQFLMPTHEFNYIGNIEGVSTWFYIFDFLGRITVGYGIYQFIQAFRKYR